MLTALPPKTKTAIEDDRPITIGRIQEPDYYVLAHEAKNRGFHVQAAGLLLFAARQLDIYFYFSETALDEWDLNIEVIDEAWGKARGGNGN